MTEILVVLAIMSILVALSLSSFAGVGNSRHLTAAGDLVVDLVNQARQNAITKNAMTAVAMVHSSGNAQWDNRLFILLELDSSNSSGVSSWTPISKWETLPTGTAVDSTQSSFISQSPDLTTPLPPLNYLGTALASSTYIYQVFLPDGSLLVPSGTTNLPPVLRVVNGMTNGSGMTYTGAQGGNIPSNYYELTINLYTGMIKVDRP